VSGTHGVVIADKPRGPTSHDVVVQARQLYGTRTVGHAGTLDPLATGVIVLLFGEAAKLSGYLTAQPKRYRATISFGRATDTLDADGQTVKECSLRDGWLDRTLLHAALEQERQRTEQQPPVFSALKIGGRRAHRLSRRGEQVRLQPRQVQVCALALADVGPSGVTVELAVSKGYYVRALARDLGARLGVPAHLSALRRTASGAFTIDEAVAWPPPRPADPLPLAVAAQRSLPVARLTEDGVRRARSGQRLSSEHFAGDALGAHARAAAQSLPAAWLDQRGRLVALGQAVRPDHFVVVRGFRSTP
jgi:tRNA pseudouridine55 synthase